MPPVALAPLQFIAAADPNQVIVFFVIIGVLVLVGIITGLRSSRGNFKTSGTSRFAFRREAKHAGLDRIQTRMMERGIKAEKIQNPISTLSSQVLLNRVLRNLIDEVRASQRPDNAKEAMVAEILKIKQILADPRKNSKGPSSRMILQGQAVKLYTAHRKPVDTFVTANLSSHLAVEMPVGEDNVPFKFAKGEKARIRIVKENGRVYRFDTKIEESAEIEGIAVLLLDHVKQMQEIQLRHSPRKSMDRPTYFQKVEIVTEGTGKKTVRRAVVQANKRHLGQILDISAGGCAIHGRNSLPVQSLIKIAFDIGPGKTIVAYGKVLSVRSESGYSSVMHIAFTRVSSANLNQIQSFVYGLSGPDK